MGNEPSRLDFRWKGISSARRRSRPMKTFGSTFSNCRASWNPLVKAMPNQGRPKKSVMPILLACLINFCYLGHKALILPPHFFYPFSVSRSETAFVFFELLKMQILHFTKRTMRFLGLCVTGALPDNILDRHPITVKKPTFTANTILAKLLLCIIQLRNEGFNFEHQFLPRNRWTLEEAEACFVMRFIKISRAV